MQPPPLADPVERKDAEHLNLLAIFHFVIAGFALLGLLFLCLHGLLMSQMFGNQEMWKNSNGGSPPPDIMGIFKWIYIVSGLFVTALGVGNLLSGLFMKRRTNRIFSLIVAGLNCINVPLGTVLGVFTIIVLTRDSVARGYALASPSGLR
ncbi:MAG: hypothetical protein MUF13_16975 [Akkermansiaceae bacterium]|nr:hypothetical protein [Akkermansiaceae bacterium]